ncbi:MAG: SufD family Fe-S cluster assembly protein [Clostridia bacterium]
MNKLNLTNIDTTLLEAVADNGNAEIGKGAFSLRKNGKSVFINNTPNITIVPKKDLPGIDIYFRAETKGETMRMPVVVTEEDINDMVYNDFYVGKNADVTIVSGCGIHNDGNKDSVHNGIHRYYLEEGARVLYKEKHYGEGSGEGKRILNPESEVHLGKNAYMEMDTVQIKGVDSTIRSTTGVLEDGASLIVKEKIMTHGYQSAETRFDVQLNGKDSRVQVTSRSVATENSTQKFVSKVYGNNECFGHVECDAIIKDNAKIISIPEIIANNIDANLIHEAAIGKIAGAQIVKLMTLGLTEEEAEQEIINGFLK